MQLLSDASPIRHLLEFTQQLGLDLDSLELNLVQQARNAQTERYAPANLIIDLMQVYATKFNRVDLGLAFGRWVKINNLGPLSTIWEHCATFRDALRISVKYLSLGNPLLSIEVFEKGDEFQLVFYVSQKTEYGCSQFLESVLMTTIQVGRSLLGANWEPLRIEVSQCSPLQSKLGQKHFQCPINSDKDRYAMICTRTDMLKVRPGVDPFMLAYHEENLASHLTESPPDFVHIIEGLVTTNLAGGSAALPDIAKLAGVSQRTLQRRLSNVGSSFATILDTVRKRRAEEYFKNESRPNLTQLAHILGYSEASTASRFLRTAGIQGKLDTTIEVPPKKN